MPYTATSPDIVLCDRLVAFISDQWKPKAPDEVKRVNRDFPLDFAALKGRKVFLAPSRFTTRWITRGHDGYLIRLDLIAVSKYPDAADPNVIVPIDWVDEQCDWWHTEIYKRLDFRTGPTFDANIQTTAIDMDDRYDATQLAVNKCFWNRTEFEFMKSDVAV